MSIKEDLDKLADLYSITWADWHININHCLTEPTCPSASITPETHDGEMDDLMRYVAWGNTIEEAIHASVELVYNELILGKPPYMEAPWTNPADAKFDEWLKNQKERIVRWKTDMKSENNEK